jgi:uncharacterized protein YcfJ
MTIQSITLTLASLALPILSGISTSANAQSQEMARVLSSTPVVTQVSVPRQVCSETQVISSSPKSGAGAVMGAIAGGAIGNNIGGGSGRAIATAAGVIGGAIFGDSIEGAPPPVARQVTSCTNQISYENRITAYNVVYEYGGKQYSIQLPNDPGPFLPVQVTPSVVAAPPMNSTTIVTSTPVITHPMAITSIAAQPLYAPPMYAPRVVGPSFYAAPAASFHFGHRQHGHHRHGHYRYEHQGRHWQ